MDTGQYDKAADSVHRLLSLARASEMKEFLIRGQWIQSLIDIQYQRYEDALNVLVHASNLAEETNSRLSQYIIQIQKSYVYHISGNSPASRDAMSYAQKIQKRLAESLPDEKTRQAFLDTPHAHHLQEMVEANSKRRVKLKENPGDDEK
jgi:hypothetical protein